MDSVDELKEFIENEVAHLSSLSVGEVSQLGNVE